MSLKTQPQIRKSSKGFKVPKMVGWGSEDSLVTVKSLLRSSELLTFNAKAKKHGKAPILVPTTHYEKDGALHWNAEFRTKVPKGVQLIRDNQLDLVPIPVITGG